MNNELGTDLVSSLRAALGVDQLLQKIDDLNDKLENMGEGEGPAYYTLKLACAKKGISYNSAKSNLRLQPKHGIEDCRISGRRMLRRSTIEAWLDITDKDDDK